MGKLVQWPILIMANLLWNLPKIWLLISVIILSNHFHSILVDSWVRVPLNSALMRIICIPWSLEHSLVALFEILFHCYNKVRCGEPWFPTFLWIWHKMLRQDLVQDELWPTQNKLLFNSFFLTGSDFGSSTRNDNGIFVYKRIYSNTEFAFTSVETSRKRISDIIKISSKITSDLGYHETATLNKSLVILKSGMNSRVRVATSLK